jgi:hypothetical protein
VFNSLLQMIPGLEERFANGSEDEHLLVGDLVCISHI